MHKIIAQRFEIVEFSKILAKLAENRALSEGVANFRKTRNAAEKPTDFYEIFMNIIVE